MSKRKDIVGIYCRLSKEDADKINKGDESESIQNQKALLVDYALNQNWSIYEIYSDDDRKGFDRDRPAFNKLLADADKSLFNIVLCKHQSRFTRDMEIVERYIHSEFIHKGIRFVSIIDHVDTAIKGTKKARQVNSLINEWYSEDLSENIRTVFAKKMEDGLALTPFAPYGYADVIIRINLYPQAKKNCSTTGVPRVKVISKVPNSLIIRISFKIFTMLG